MAWLRTTRLAARTTTHARSTTAATRSTSAKTPIARFTRWSRLTRRSLPGTAAAGGGVGRGRGRVRRRNAIYPVVKPSPCRGYRGLEVERELARGELRDFRDGGCRRTLRRSIKCAGSCASDLGPAHRQPSQREHRSSSRAGIASGEAATCHLGWSRQSLSRANPWSGFVRRLAGWWLHCRRRGSRTVLPRRMR